ncbi:hypothetical protein [Bacillus mycoides]|uniref:Uncharacterized protein n=1 Tax=Bacillus mycoides TaxID=1405 RepID=A0A4U3A7R6_BACMY|nr:hypothetical protein [Bacillus mycoides]TKI82900.1 hypothetical protein FC701_19735 [Bacillus mycoides]
MQSDSNLLKSSLIIDGQPNHLMNPTSLLTTRYSWEGDDISNLPMRVGEIPQLYSPSPGFRRFIRGVHEPGYLSYGPYLTPDLGSLTGLYFFAFAENFTGNPNDPVAYFDLVNTANGSREELANPLTLYVKDFPGIGKAFGVFLDNSIEVNNEMQIEARVRALGGGNLSLFHMYWYINYL